MPTESCQLSECLSFSSRVGAGEGRLSIPRQPRLIPFRGLLFFYGDVTVIKCNQVLTFHRIRMTTSSPFLNSSSNSMYLCADIEYSLQGKYPGGSIGAEP